MVTISNFEQSSLFFQLYYIGKLICSTKGNFVLQNKSNCITKYIELYYEYLNCTTISLIVLQRIARMKNIGL